MQTTSNILMIRPVSFSFNAETAVNNAFQVAGHNDAAQQLALNEFETFVEVLRSKDVNVIVVNDTPEPHTPDSIFPNNWISFHDDGTVCLYPMYAQNRRHERKPAIIERISKSFKINNKIDLTGYENQDMFLEGTGSMVLDRDNKIAYACLSPRTHSKVLDRFCEVMKYRPVAFTSNDAGGNAIYHTNVMMCVGEKFVLIVLASITDERERSYVKQVITESGKKVIDISLAQMNEFAGNMLLVKNSKEERLLVMSSRAYASLTADQIESLGVEIVHSPLTTIELNGGGSARCMMAEVHLKEL